MGERREIEPEWQLTLRRKLKEAEKSGTLLLMQEGLKTLPPQIEAMGHKLHTLRLGRNRLDLCRGPLVWYKSLKSLHTLSLKSTKLRVLDPSVSVLSSLELFEIQNNRLTALPDTICRCRRLKRLLADSNRITDLPERIGELTALVDLWIDYNAVELIPESFSALRKLVTFKATRNGIYNLPDSFTRLGKLQVLTLSCNGKSSAAAAGRTRGSL